MSVNIFEYNGSTVIAMKGKNCVAIASDKRFATARTTQDINMQRIFKINSKVYVGFSGLVTDVDTMHETLIFHHQLYKLRENRDMSPAVLSHLICNLLYEKRWGPYFVEPIVAGLDENNEPFVSTSDSVGAEEKSSPFVGSGTGYSGIIGSCEALYYYIIYLVIKKIWNLKNYLKLLVKCYLLV